MSEISVHLQAGFDAYDRGDYETALKKFLPLSDQGDAAAQYNLGLMYEQGKGVPQDYAEAVKWFRLAADQGHVTAQNNLGMMYRMGLGVPQDYVQANMWINLAVAQGYEGAFIAQKFFEELMTPAQLAEAQRLAREWKPKGK